MGAYRLLLIRASREHDQLVMLECSTDAEAIDEMGLYATAASTLELWRGETLVAKSHAPAKSWLH